MSKLPITPVSPPPYDPLIVYQYEVERLVSLKLVTEALLDKKMNPEKFVRVDVTPYGFLVTSNNCTRDCFILLGLTPNESTTAIDACFEKLLYLPTLWDEMAKVEYDNNRVSLNLSNQSDKINLVVQGDRPTLKGLQRMSVDVFEHQANILLSPENASTGSTIIPSADYILMLHHLFKDTTVSDIYELTVSVQGNTITLKVGGSNPWEATYGMSTEITNQRSYCASFQWACGDFLMKISGSEVCFSVKILGTEYITFRLDFPGFGVLEYTSKCYEEAD